MSYKKRTFYEVFTIIFGLLVLSIAALFLVNILYYLVKANFNFSRTVVTETLGPQGEFVEVNGEKMHIYCTGDGDDVAVLEADKKNWSIYWRVIQDEISKYSKVCSYDRLGHGWSSGQVQGDEATVETLYDLLKAAGHQGPYILAGHKWGAENVMRFVEEYPSEVKAMVLYDYPIDKEEALMEAYMTDKLNVPLVIVAPVIKNLSPDEQAKLDAMKIEMNFKLERWQENSSYIVIDNNDRFKTLKAISTAITGFDELD